METTKKPNGFQEVKMEMPTDAILVGRVGTFRKADGKLFFRDITFFNPRMSFRVRLTSASYDDLSIEVIR